MTMHDTLEIAEVKVLWADRLPLRPGGWDFDRLPSNHWRLYQNDAPGGMLVTAAGTLPLDAKAVYIIPAGIAFGTRCSQPFRQTFIHFDVAGLSTIALSELFPNPVAVPDSVAFAGAVEEMGERIAGRWNADRTTLSWWVRGVIFEALGRNLSALPEERLERYHRRTGALRPIFPALDALHDAPGEIPANADLAALCHMSEDHFIRRFRDAVGKSPGRYRLERRVALAAHRLLFSDDSIEAIAEATGFRNRFYFSRVFVRETGISPAAYRREPRT